MSTQTFIGNITKKEFKEGAKDGKAWKMCIFTIGGDFKCSTFNSDIFDNSQYDIGFPVKAIYEVSGKYNNLLEFEEVSESDKATAPQATGGSETTKEEWTAKEKRIIRQSCQKRAIAYVTLMASLEDGPEQIKKVLEATEGGFMGLIDSVALHFENQVWKE